MPPDSDWLEALRALKRCFDAAFFAADAYAAKIETLLATPGSPVESLRFEFQPQPPLTSATISAGPARPYSDVRTATAIDAFGTKAVVSIGQWQEGPQLDDVVVGALVDLARSVWRGDCRDAKARIVSLLTANGKASASRSLPGHTETEWLALHFADLDRFKQVNDTRGEQEGDRVILEMSGVLVSVCHPTAIALHRSGDEFVLMQWCESPQEAIGLAHRAMDAITRHDFNVAPLSPSLSIGIALVRCDQSLDFDALEYMAEKALKPQGGEKQRGLARIALRDRSAQLSPASEDAERLAVALARSAVLAPDPFGNPWLSFISRKVHDAADGDIGSVECQEAVEESLGWIRPTVRSLARESARDPDWIGCQAELSEFDVLIAASHGLMRAHADGRLGWTTGTLRIETEQTRRVWRLVHENGRVLAELEATGPVNDSTWIIGGPLDLETRDRSTDGRRAVLVRIGHAPLPAPRQLFSDVVIVDDRPTSGGGLPDLWAASVARVLAAVNRNPNVEAVYVVGNEAHGAETIRQLRSIADGKSDLDYLVYKTGLLRREVSDAVTQLSGRVWSVASAAELVQNLVGLVVARCWLQPRRLEDKSTTPRRLQRVLQTQSMGLGVQQGIRVGTVADAYPIVVELARHAEGEVLYDQSSAKMREIVDFRIQLTNPSTELVPAFYAQEAESLEAYFQKQFCAPDGLFAERFSEDGQLDAVLAHVVRCANSPDHPVATRRAILVVRHRVEQADDLAPLGLVSVRLVPRFLPGRVRMSYSYTWRTVEALVGCAYSLYGSVRYAQYLTEQIKTRMAGNPSARSVELGEVSYIAHSLHLFVDDYGLRIARQIVAHASE